MVALHNLDHFVVRRLRCLFVEPFCFTVFKLRHRVNSHASISYLRQTARLAAAFLTVSRAENCRRLHLRGDHVDADDDAAFDVRFSNSQLFADETSHCFRYGF